jgi:hypothetical protein
MTTSDDTNRAANLQALQRMLAYAMVETRREGLLEVVELLSTAQLMIGNALRQGEPPAEPPAVSAEPKIRLAASRDVHYAESGETKV